MEPTPLWADVPPCARLPRNLSDLTPEWLTSALGQTWPGIVVDSANLVETIRGASTKARIELRTNRNDVPPCMIVKAGFEAHSDNMRSMHDNEMHAYRDLIPTIDINAPKCFFAGRDADGHSLVIIEDLNLRAVHFLSLQQPIGYDLAKRFLEGLARIHARWWGAPELAGPRFAWVPDTSEEQFIHYFGILADPDRFEVFRSAPRGAAMPRVLLDPVRVRAAHAAMRAAHKDKPKVISHGDMHLGNLYTDADGTPAFLDWQPRIAHWSLDVSYFIIAALDLPDRRRWEGGLLQHYLACLASHGIAAPSFESAWLDYRRDVVWGLLIWMLNGTEFQTESNNTAAATRFAMAMIDHDTFGILGV